MLGNIRRYIVWLVTICVCLPLYVFFYLQESYIQFIMRRMDIFSGLITFIAWRFLEFLFAGVLLGFVGLIVMFFFHRYFLIGELWFEAKLLRARIVVLDRTPKISMVFLLKAAYILFGPIVILTRLLTTIKNVGEGDVILYYLEIGEFMTKHFWHILLIVVPLYFMIEISRIREFDTEKLIIKYPSRILNLFLVIVIGAGSIASLIPIYYDLLIIFGDPQRALYLFIYAILYFYLPAFGAILGFLLVLVGLASRETRKILSSLEDRLIRYGVAKLSKIEVT